MLLARCGKYYQSTFVGCMILAAPCIHGSPLKDPRRLVNGLSVDLSPLFRWWSSPGGDRPLKAWVHVTGAVKGTNTWGWVVEARIDTSGPGQGGVESQKEARIILRHPPAAEMAEFESLVAQHKDLDQQHAKLTAQATQAGKREQQAAQREASGSVSPTRAALLEQQAERASQSEKDAEDQLKTVDQQLKEVNEKLATFPSAANYIVDTFALDVGQQIGGMPVFDRGSIWK